MEHKLQVLVDVTVVKQLEVLEYDAHITAQSRNVLALQRCQISIKHFGGLCIVLVDIHLTIKGFKQSRLSRPHLTYYIYKLVGIHLKIDTFENHLVSLIDVDLVIFYQHNMKICFEFLYFNVCANLEHGAP